MYEIVLYDFLLIYIIIYTVVTTKPMMGFMTAQYVCNPNMDE